VIVIVIVVIVVVVVVVVTTTTITRGDHFQFDSVFIKKKATKPKKKLRKKENINQFKPTSFGLVWFF
jgi:uncharacterized protein YxeA